MKLTTPLKSVGWLSGSGHQAIIDEEAKKNATSARETRTDGKSGTREKASNESSVVTAAAR